MICYLNARELKGRSLPRTTLWPAGSYAGPDQIDIKGAAQGGRSYLTWM